MFRKREKKEYPPGTFIPMPARVMAIIQLCIAFSALLWILSQPFMGDLFTIRSQLLYYEIVMGKHTYADPELIQRNTERFNALPLEKKLSLEEGYRALKAEMQTTFIEKLKRSLQLLLAKTPLMELMWIFFSIVIPILLLKRVEGAASAVWLLVLITIAYAVDNRLNGVKFEQSESWLFPTEELLLQDYVREPLKENPFDQEQQLTRGWQLYLVDQWANEPVSQNPELFALQIEDGEFAFNIARIQAMPPIKKILSFNTLPLRLSLLTLACYLFWNLLLALVVKRYCHSNKANHAIILLPLLFLIAGCTTQCHDFPVMGADEFVMDSYTIRQGKLAILEMEGVEVEEMPDRAMDEYQDTIAEDDLLNIVIYHPKRRDLMEAIQFINQAVGGFRVVRGEVSLPDIPPIIVEGLTLEEAKVKLQNEYRNQIQDVELFISYQDRLKSKVEIAGLVATTTVPVDGKIRLFEVIAKAHISPESNLFMSYVMRDGKALPIDLHQLINQGDMCQNIVMRGGDKIFIANPRDAVAMVMGEVFRPGPVLLPYGSLSLREALVSVGGIPFTGDKRHIQVIRGNLPCPKVYVLAWEHIINLPNDSLLIMPGDTIYVSAKPITEWNRFIEQLLPTTAFLQTGHYLYRFAD